MQTVKQEKNESSSTDEAGVIDTSQMSKGQREALEITEAARDTGGGKLGFVSDLFMGRWSPRKVYPFPLQTHEEEDQGDAFLKKFSGYLREHADPDEIDKTGEIPPEVIKALGDMGAFAIKVDRQYGGLGLSQTNYCRAAVMAGSYCGNLTALLSAHQSIGVPQPLILFGTDEQKEKYLPRFAKGAISAFALTEEGVGSDPARMKTEAKPTEDGSHFIINGEKLWCTNVVKSDVIVVMARTPDKMVHGKPRSQITAFIVEMDMPGVEIVTRCRFMGLKALYNGVVRFKDVRVPKENIILGEGKGLKVALSTLNTGRLTLPAACLGLAKRCIAVVKKWASEREQWGAAIGKHQAIAEKIATMSAGTFAIDAMVFHTCRMVDRNKKADIRLEAAMSKMWGTEKCWEIVDETMQIRGGRGYETAESLRNRGEEAIAVERFMRDCRINLIFEGSSEIMRLFIMREALDPHLKIGAAVFNTRLPFAQRLLGAIRAGCYYAFWYPCLWLPVIGAAPGGMHSGLARHYRYAARATKRMARALFHQMLRFGPKLDRQQVLLGKIADIGTEIFGIAVTCARAQALADRHGDDNPYLELADVHCHQARHRIEHAFRDISKNSTAQNYRLAQNVLRGNYQWLEDGML